MTTTADDLLHDVLERARSLGFLGPGPLRVHIEHARQFLPPLAELDRGRVLDLGSGGGLPGLVVALARPDLEVVLLDASNRRCAFLMWAVGTLGVDDRVSVWEGRAEELAARHRDEFDAVTARGFGPPGQTVECALAYMRTGARLVLSEPPDRRPWRAPSLEGCELRVRDEWPGVVCIELIAGVAPPWIPRSIKRQRAEPLGVLEG